MDVEIAPFDLTARLAEARTLARTAMSAAGQPGGFLVAKYLQEVTDIPGLLPLGAHRQDELVGMLVGWPIANRDWWRERIRPALTVTENVHWLDDAFELAELHVHPDLQGNGIGSALLDNAERMIDQQRIVLSTNAIDNWRAREFYRRRGFRTLTPPFRWLGLDLRIFVLGREIPR